MKLQNLAALVLSAAVGCASVDQHRERLKNYTPVTQETRYNPDGSQREPFDRMSPGLAEFVERIYIINPVDFCRNTCKAHKHCEDETICLGLGYKRASANHEGAHVRQDVLDKLGKNFSGRWKAIAAFNYDKTKVILDGDSLLDAVWNDDSKGPMNGCMSPYGGSELVEDIATFVAQAALEETPEQVLRIIVHAREIFREDVANGEMKSEEAENSLNSLIKTYVCDDPLYFCDTADVRYQRKFDLLHAEGFYTEEEHESVRGNCGSLRALLEMRVSQ